MDDIPPRSNHIFPIADDVRYPEGSRYSAHWLEPGGNGQIMVPNNTDATFGRYSAARKPSALLLHYNYGAAAVKRWGRNEHLLQSQTTESRPPKPPPKSFRPPFIPAKRGVAIEKRKKALAAEEAKRAGASTGATHNAAWDEDDAMLFFWGNSRAAKERYRKTSEAKRESLEQWRRGIPAH